MASLTSQEPAQREWGLRGRLRSATGATKAEVEAARAELKTDSPTPSRRC